jgi:hypothetical protein
MQPIAAALASLLLISACAPAQSSWPCSDCELAPAVPVQTMITTPLARPLQGYTLHLRASYRVSALIRHVQGYDHWWSRDSMGSLVPYDAVLAWGPSSNPAQIRKVTIRQFGRYYTWHTREPITPDRTRMLSESMANTHLIPATDELRGTLDLLEPGQLVRLEGYLVDVEGSDAPRMWRTSLTRQDQGSGACEVMLVEGVTILSHGNR